MPLSSQDEIQILHVDDEPDFAELTATYLEHEDDQFSVKTATSAHEGLQYINDRPPDCVVSDYNMPGMDGLEFLQAVREEYPDLPFILFTGKGSEAVASDAIAAGVTDYLQKGKGASQYEVLANRIENAVSQTRTRQQVRRQREQLEQLHEATRELMKAETRGEIAERASTISRRVLSLPLNGVHYYDPDRNGLVPVAISDEVEDILGDPPVIGPGEGVAWTAYETGEPQIYRDVRNAPEVMNPETPIRSEFHIPLGDHGVLIIASTTPDDFTETDVSSAHILAANLTAVLDRLEREADLRNREQELETRAAAMEASIDGMAILNADEEYMFVNQAHADIYGYDDPEAFFDGTWQMCYDRGEVDRIETEVMPTLLAEGSWRGEAVGTRRDGSTFPQELSLTRLEDGKIICVVRDITDWKQHETALRALHGATKDFMKAPDKQSIADAAVETARSALDQPICGLWLHDPDADILRPVVMTDEGANLLENQPTYTGGESLSWEAFRDGEFRVYDDIASEPGRLNPDTPIRSEIIIPLGDHGVMNLGATEPADFSAIDISLARILGNTVAAALSRADREQQLRNRQAELERQNERLEEFASIVSHDLRNPLTVAGGHLELAQETCESDHLVQAAAAIERSQALIDDLLALAREGDRVDETESVGLAEVAENSWQTVETRQATLDADASQVIEADRSRLQQLLENLYRNAVEHGGDDVTVSVGVMNDGFYVADTGTGIPESDREEVFKAGYSTAEEGTGFGLRIVEQIAKAHGWEITVTESEQGGARFDITGVELLEC